MTLIIYKKNIHKYIMIKNEYCKNLTKVWFKIWKVFFICIIIKILNKNHKNKLLN